MDNEKILNADGGRTPIGSLDGALKDVPADERGATAGRGAIERAGDGPSQLEGAVMGCSGTLVAQAVTVGGDATSPWPRGSVGCDVGLPP